MLVPPGSFGENLRSHRSRVGLTQQQLAERSGVSIRALRYIERGEVGMPRADSVRRLAEALGVEPETLAQSGPPRARPSGAPQLRLSVLGPFTVAHGERALEVGALKQRSLLALLALHPNRPVGREEIIDVLWGESPPDSCLGLVHTYASRLRRALVSASRRHAGVIVSTPNGYRLTVKADQLDLVRFDGLAARAREIRATDPDAAADLLDEALACWRGPVLADLPGRLRRHPTAVAVAARRREAALAHADIALALGRHARVVANIRGLAHEEPLHEGLHARLMLGLAGTGEQAEALRVFSDIRTRLDEELGVEPGLEIQDAHLRVLRDRPAAPAAPEPIAARPPAQLPAETPGFVGRAAPLAGLDKLLDRLDGHPGVVIVALSGTAGVGKTALALRWAHRARERFPDGQLSVNLHGYASGSTPLTTHEVLVRFLHALGVAPERVPADTDEAAGLYRTLLTGKRVLVLLDNAATAEQVRPLLPGSSGCLVLVTSRDRLTGLTAQDGAHQLPLDVLDADEAVDLLGRLVGVGRMRREPDAAAEMAAICGHLPLALRIAGANLAIRPLISIADYTRELRERGRIAGLAVAGDESGAVRAAFDLSYEKLTPAARRLFRLLGALPGTDVDAAAAAALSGLPPTDAARLLRVLDHGNLIREHSRGRYTFHDLLREYASDRAAAEDTEADRVAAVVALFDHYLREIETHSAILWRVGAAAPEPGAEDRAIAWLDAERANLVAAAVAAPGLGLHRYSWRFAEALRPYFWNRGHGAEGIAVGQAALAAARGADDVDAEASVRDLLGAIHTNLSDYVTAIEHHRWALELAQGTGNRIVEASALHNLGRAHSQLGQPAQASAFYEQALELNRMIGNRFGEAGALHYLGGAALSLGRPQDAIERHTNALELSTRIGHRHVQAAACQGLGLALWAMGDLPRAAQRYREALAICRRYGYRHGEVSMLICLAETGCDAGDYAAAAAQVRQAMEAGRQLGERRHEVSGLDILASIQQRTGEWSSAAMHYARALGLAREIRFGYGEASILTGMCALYRRTGDPRAAIDHGTGALALMRDTGMRLLEARALTELAHAYLDSGDSESAADQIEQGMAIAGRTGQRLAEARARHVRALVRQVSGDRTGALADWQAALPVFERLGVPEGAHVRALLAAFAA
ncbi:BTAD domain-containing putative transcriptional regulator [Actinokineospora iranica]|uniref:DNA-binding transcriptional activator of the SARP family n=1 Tax=Actinokineospora iranica TaxID=1271860 RepID=A0A1G6X509_9PSEU|nr:BTAD domain-containing putative transcriptional regulator [Actinokineospora iranica]SDD73290.1 DNA-binding transcriptional activator of the SARP family [Actinokineospora iranica]